MVTSDDSNSTIATLTSRLAALEHLLSSNNIALPTNLAAEDPPDHESHGDSGRPN